MRSPWSALLDASICFSFDRSGYARHARRFDPRDLEVDARGRRCLVTGGNSGIGLAAARGLAARGAEVLLLCRDGERGRAAAEALRAETGNPGVSASVLDLSDLDAIRAWASAWDGERVDVLVHNAGLLVPERRLSPQGLELTFATHVAGPFLLTRLLEGRLSAGARVIWVSSGGMYARRLSLEDVGWEARPWDGVAAYAQTKRMQVVLARLFAERWDPALAVSHVMHPGWADTPGVRTALPRFWRLLHGRLRTPEEGADTVVWLALATAAARGSSGQVWFDRAPRSAWLLPGTRESAPERRRLWALCEELTAPALAASSAAARGSQPAPAGEGGARG